MKIIHFRRLPSGWEMFVINPDGAPATNATAVLWDDEQFWILYAHHEGVGAANTIAAMAWVETMACTV